MHAIGVSRSMHGTGECRRNHHQHHVPGDDQYFGLLGVHRQPVRRMPAARLLLGGRDVGKCDAPRAPLSKTVLRNRRDGRLFCFTHHRAESRGLSSACIDNHEESVAG